VHLWLRLKAKKQKKKDKKVKRKCTDRIKREIMVNEPLQTAEDTDKVRLNII